MRINAKLRYLQPTFETCRESEGASSVTYKSLESSMYKTRKILQPKIPSSVQEFDLLVQESQYSDCNLQTVVDADQIAAIFGSRHMIDKSKNALDIQFDGKFTAIPILFYQLFTVFINVTGHTLPGWGRCICQIYAFVRQSMHLSDRSMHLSDIYIWLTEVFIWRQYISYYLLKYLIA